MDVENVKIIDGLIFGYLSRQQYHETLRSLCNEAPSLRDATNRFQADAGVFIQVNDQLHDKTLEQIIQAFAIVGRFDVTPELIDFGVRLRSLTNEFSTMTSMRGRSLSDNQLKLYGKRAYSKTHQSRQTPSNTSLRCESAPTAAHRPTVYCVTPSNDAEYMRHLHENAVSASMEHSAQQQPPSQQDLSYNYQSQQHVTSSFTVPSSSLFAPQPAVQSSTVTTVQTQSTQNTPSYQTSQILPSVQPSAISEEPVLMDYGVNVKNQENMELTPQINAIGTTAAVVDPEQGSSQAHMSSSFTSESGAHKRKTAVPHRREELVAHTAQSLIASNGVLLDLEADGAASTTSQVSLLSNIDDSAMQCLDRLINGNLDEVFPFCDDHDLSEFAATMENPFPPNKTNENEPEQGADNAVEDAAPPPLDVGPSHSPPPQESNAKNRSFDDGEIISDESNQAKASKTNSLENFAAKTEEREVATPPPVCNDTRHSSIDSGKGRRDENKRIADRLREFGRNPPKSDLRRVEIFATENSCDSSDFSSAKGSPHTSKTLFEKRFMPPRQCTSHLGHFDHHLRKTSMERTDSRETSSQETRNVSRSSPSGAVGGRPSRDRDRRLSALFDEGSAPSSRDSSPHRERLSKKEEERRRREKEMEKERQRDKERLRRQKREREAQRDRERSHRNSPDRKATDKRPHRDEEEKVRDTRSKERKREQAEEQKVMDEAEKRKAEERARREMMKKKKEEELEAKRQAELQRRAEAMRRKEEENRRRREEKERLEEKRREEQRQREEERLQREEERKRKEEEQRREEEETRKFAELEENKEGANDDEEAEEVDKSDEEADQADSGDSDDAAASEDNQTARNYSEDEENQPRKEVSTQEQWVHPKKLEQKKTSESSTSRSIEEPQQENEQDPNPSAESEEKKKKYRDEHRPSRSSSDIRKNLPVPFSSRRREDSKRQPARPLEPGMMMSDTHVLDRINKEMESLSSRNRTSQNRSPDETATTSRSTPSTKIPKRDAPVDYAQVLFSNAPVIKRTPPIVEKKRNLVISSGLTTEHPNQLVFSKAHSSRLGMFLEKASDKHRRLMIEHDGESEVASPLYEDPDHGGGRSPFTVSQYSRQSSQRYAPQKRPMPASSMDSYLGSPAQSSPDIRDADSTSSRSSSKKPKIDLSRMPDIIDKLYSNK